MKSRAWGPAQKEASATWSRRTLPPLWWSGPIPRPVPCNGKMHLSPVQGTHWHSRNTDFRCQVQTAEAPTTWAQVAASIQAAKANMSAAAASPPSHEATDTKSAEGSSTAGGKQGLEGRTLALHLGPLPLIEQRFTVSSRAPQTSSKKAPSAPTAGTRVQEFKLVAPLDVDQVMDVYIDSGVDGDPFWTRAWPSAIALAADILAHPELVRGKRVADLGCGLGLPGLAAALSGASEVVLLDRDVLALQCALLSALATLGAEHVTVNGLRVGTAHSADDTHPSTFSFHGPDLSSYLASQPASAHAAASQSITQHHKPQLPSVRAQVFDWTAGPEPLLAEAGGRFDVVLACDVLYEETAVEPIASLVPSILKAVDGYLLLADPPNRTAKNRERFVQLLLDAAAVSAGQGKARAARVMLDSCELVDSCKIRQLDPEMVGGLLQPGKQGAEEVVPIQMMVFRSSIGANTVGVKPT